MGEPCKLHVGNLSYDCTEEDIRKEFEKCGAVEQVIICTDRETGRPRGFGFVIFEKEEHAQAAIAKLDNEDCCGRPMRVNPSRARSEGGGGRSYGGGRGGGRGGGYRYGGGGDGYSGGRGDGYSGGRGGRYGSGGGGGGQSSYSGRSYGGGNENY